MANQDIKDEKAVQQHQSVEKRKSSSLPRLALEVFSIVLGVLLARGSVVDERHFQEQFIGYFQLLIQLETQLLDSCRDVLGTINQRGQQLRETTNVSI